MLSLVNHPYVPRVIEYQKIKKQSVLVMERAKGADLEKIVSPFKIQSSNALKISLSEISIRSTPNVDDCN
jgi:non-specific serine/threonine protein kinase